MNNFICIKTAFKFEFEQKYLLYFAYYIVTRMTLFCTLTCVDVTPTLGFSGYVTRRDEMLKWRDGNLASFSCERWTYVDVRRSALTWCQVLAAIGLIVW